MNSKIILFKEKNNYNHLAILNGFKKNEYLLQVTTDTPLKLKNPKVVCDFKLKQLLKGNLKLLKKKLAATESVERFIDDIQTLIKKKEGCTKLSTQGIHWRNLLLQLWCIGLQNVASINEELTAITLTHADEHNRRHNINFRINSHPSLTISLDDYDLPGESICNHSTPFTHDSLIQLYTAFKQRITVLQLPWLLLQQLDDQLIILPEINSTKNNASSSSSSSSSSFSKELHRRVALGPSTSVVITLYDSHKPPSLSFHGSRCDIEKLEKNVEKNILQWDQNHEEDYVEKLSWLLGVDLKHVLYSSALKDADDEDEDQEECGLCFSHDLEGEKPSIHCPNHSLTPPICPFVYHRTCILEWLRSQRTTRQKYSVIFGACPNCKQDITVSV